MELKIEYVDIDSIKPYKNNAKQHPKEQIEQIKKSIKQFGMDDPIGIWKDEIVEGHGRLIACKELGYTEVPIIRLDHLTDEERKAYTLAHNKLTMNSDFDLDILQEELDNFDTIDMSDFGFDIDLDIEEETEIIEDEVPDVPEEPKAKLGDIYQLGNHRLMCGDSTKEEDVAKLMNGVKADMVFTDPPYGMNLDTDFSSMQNHLDFAKEKGFTGGKKYEQGIVDDFNPKMIDLIMSLDVKETFLWGADYFAELLPNKNNGSWIVWDKRANGNDNIEEDYSSDKMYGSCFELCWSKNRHKRDIARVKWAGVFGTEQEFDHKRYHPTQKPIKLCEWFIKKYSDDNNIILDLFGGSGSTLIACEQLNRKCYMMELDPHYIDVIIQRWENFTGEKAVKLN
jgi:site-specific DNA-methyltransferase (adenine-specific)